jgi:hypothetical protein
MQGAQSIESGAVDTLADKFELQLQTRVSLLAESCRVAFDRSQKGSAQFRTSYIINSETKPPTKPSFRIPKLLTGSNK